MLLNLLGTVTAYMAMYVCFGRFADDIDRYGISVFVVNVRSTLPTLHHT